MANGIFVLAMYLTAMTYHEMLCEIFFSLSPYYLYYFFQLMQKQEIIGLQVCLQVLKGQWCQGDLQDGRGVRRGDHLPPHKYIRNTSTCGTTPTEHLLNAGRKPQTFQRQENPHVPGQGKRKMKKQRQKNRDRTCTSGREL